MEAKIHFGANMFFGASLVNYLHAHCVKAYLGGPKLTCAVLQEVRTDWRSLTYWWTKHRRTFIIIRDKSHTYVLINDSVFGCPAAL